MTSPQQYEIPSLNLSSTQYIIEQTGKDKNSRPEYEARNITGDTIFQCTYNMYEEEDEFAFIDDDENRIFTVRAIDTWDIAGDYLLTDNHTEEEIVILDNDFSLLQDTWRIRDVEDQSLLAEINSRGAPVTVGRKILPFGQWIGHQYEIADTEGDSIGTIESDFAVFDQYEITIRDNSSIPSGPIVAGTVVMDGIQGN